VKVFVVTRDDKRNIDNTEPDRRFARGRQGSLGSRRTIA